MVALRLSLRRRLLQWCHLFNNVALPVNYYFLLAVVVVRVWLVASGSCYGTHIHILSALRQRETLADPANSEMFHHSFESLGVLLIGKCGANYAALFPRASPNAARRFSQLREFGKGSVHFIKYFTLT